MKFESEYGCKCRHYSQLHSILSSKIKPLQHYMYYMGRETLNIFETSEKS